MANQSTTSPEMEASPEPDKDQFMLTSSRKFTLYLFTAIVILAVLMVSIKPLAVTYHRLRFHQLNDYMTNGPSTTDSNGLLVKDLTEVGPKHAYHMQRLVQLGQIAKLRVPMSNLRLATVESKNFFKMLLNAESPAALYWQSQSSDPIIVEVWCELDAVEDWKNFLHRENLRAAGGS